MIEIVFGDSACGSLKVAQHFGKGKYRRGASSFFLVHSDGSKPTKEEYAKARQEYEEREQKLWEKAEPLGGSAADVFCFSLALSYGEISEGLSGRQRKKALEMLYLPIPGIPEEEDEENRQSVLAFADRAEEDLPTIFARMALGEAVRIWYSSNPDELCGLYWLMAQFYQEKAECGKLFLVKLPEWEEREDGVTVKKISWGEVSAEEWSRYLTLQKQVSEPFVRMCAVHWQKLQEENAALRAVVNGQLVSVREDFYDPFILHEIDDVEENFVEARLIGKIMGKYQLGISDGWLHLRMEKMIEDGILEVVSPAEKGKMGYARVLKKIGNLS